MLNIIKWAKRRRICYILKRQPIAFDLWREVLRKAKLLQGLDSVQKAQLRVLATLFLHRKRITAADGFQLNDEMIVVIAAQAVLPILKLGLDYYSGWIEIIVYPAAFRVNHGNADLNGVTSNEANLLSGEAWLRGPVILSWEDIERDLHSRHPGHNVVVHEFAHKLDMLNGSANGMPPLHPRMEIKQWTQALSVAYEDLRRQVAHHHRTRINSYGATTPAEFFAVVSECFFSAPDILNHYCPQVYQQLIQFYRQDPLTYQPNVDMA